MIVDLAAPNAFRPHKPCPCGSGCLVAECQCQSRRFVPKPVLTAPRGLFTGVRNARCYAGFDHNCAGKISREHAFTNAVYEDWGLKTLTRTLHSGETIELPPSGAGRKVLCQRHNTALSPLDQVGRRFIAAHRAHLRKWHENDPETDHVLFSGFDVERWMLKVLCGTCHGERASRVHPSRIWHVPPAWAEVVFYGAPLPPGAGLYLPRIRRGSFSKGVLTAVITGKHKLGDPRALGTTIDVTVVGISMCIYGHDYDLLMASPELPHEYWYRCRMLRSPRASGGISHIHLGWDDAPPTFAGKRAPVEQVATRDDLLR